MTSIAESTTEPPPAAAISAKNAADLRDRVEIVARRALRTVRWRAVLLSAVSVIVCLLIGVACDVGWRSSGAAPRWLLFALLVLVGGGSIARWLIPAFRVRISLVEAARKIENFFPELSDRLSSVIALHEAPVGGVHRAEQLIQRGTIETFQSTGGYALSDALQPHRNRNLMITACSLGGLFLLLFLLLPQQVPLALRRITMPWVDASWPREHVLQLVGLPPRTHAGSDLQLAVHDRQGPLPVDLTLWATNGSTAQSTRLPLNASPEPAGSDDLSSRAVVIPGEWVEEGLAIRAVGGDDRDMPWQRVEIVTPPRIREARLRVTPPPYTGLPAFETDDSLIRLPANSQLQFQATVDRPLKSAEWSKAPAPQATLHLSDEGTSLQSIWQAPAHAQSQPLSIAWFDTSGVPGRSAKSWQLQVAPDRPPQLHWRQLPSHSQFTPDAVIPLSWQAVDDYGIASSWWEVDVTSPETPSSNDETKASQGFLKDHQPAGDGQLARQVQRSETLDLSALKKLNPGTTVQVVAVAVDGLGQRGETPPFQLQIVSEEKLQSRFAEAGKRILDRVRDARTQQQLARERTEETRGRLGDDAESHQAAADMLRIAEAAQQATLRQLDGGPQAAIDDAQELLQQSKINRLENSVVSAIQEAVSRLSTTRDESIVPAHDSLQETADQLRRGNTDQASLGETLQRAIDHQQQSDQDLQAVVDALSASLQVESVARTIQELSAAQRRLAGATVRSDEARRPAEERARLSAAQQALARQAEQLKGELEKLASSGELSDDRRQAFADASERLQDQRTPQRMRTAAETLRDQRLGESIDQQRQIANDLTDLARELQRGETDGTAADQAAEWIRQARRIADRQSEIATAIRQVIALQGVGGDQAVTDQQEHASRTERFARSIDDLPLFGDAVRASQLEMIAAAARLDRDGADPRAADQANAAAERLREIAEALQSAAFQRPSNNSAAEDSPPEESSGEQADDDQQKPIPLESVLLMRTIQQRLKRETEQLQPLQEPSDGSPNEALREREDRRREIRRQQSQLFEQLRELVEGTDD